MPGTISAPYDVGCCPPAPGFKLMDWTTALTLPSPQLLIAGGVGLLLCLLLLAQLRQTLGHGRDRKSVV